MIRFVLIAAVLLALSAGAIALLSPADVPAPALAQTEPATRGAPTREQILEAARAAAAEDGSRAAWLHVARYSRKHDSEHALEDFRAGSQAPAHGSTQVQRGVDRQLVEGLRQFGAEAQAQAILESALRAAIDDGEQAEDARVGIWHRDHARMAAEMAAMLWPANRELIQQAADALAGWSDLAPDGRARYQEQVAAAHAEVLALLHPDQAWQNLLAAGPEHRPSVALVTNLGRADPGLAAELLDLFEARGVSDNSGPGTVASELAAALLKTDTEAGVARLAEWSATGDVFWDRAIVARAAAQVGVAALPEKSEYEQVYASLCGELAEIDADAGLTLARRLTAKPQRAAALGRIVSVIADTNRPLAEELAMETIRLWEWTPPEYEQAVMASGYALAEGGGEIVGALTGRLLTARYAAGLWWRWRSLHREEADAWIDRQPEKKRYEILAHSLFNAAGDGARDEVVALAHRVMALPEFETGNRMAAIVFNLASVAPDLAREAWQSVPSPTAKLCGRGDGRYLDGLLTIAEAFERRDPGSAAPEIAEIERVLAGGLNSDHAEFEYRGKLCRLYALIDPDRARAAADELLADMQAESDWVTYPAERTRAAGDALAALAASDMAAAEAKLAALQAQQREYQQRELLVVFAGSVALRDPAAAIALVERDTDDRHREAALRNTLTAVWREGSPEVVHRCAELWINGVEDRETAKRREREEQSGGGYADAGPDTAQVRLETISSVIRRLAEQERPELEPVIEQLLAMPKGAGQIATVLSSCGRDALPLASDAMLDRFERELMAELAAQQERMATAVPPGRTEPPRPDELPVWSAWAPPQPDWHLLEAVRLLASEIASRDWERGLALIRRLEPAHQVSALLDARVAEEPR